MDLLESLKRKSQQIPDTRHPWEQARTYFFKKLITNYIPIQSKSVVLDIGCGDTYVVENLAKEYPETLFFAVDTAFSEDLLNAYREKILLKNLFLFQSLNEIPELIEQKYSLIILSDVLEHIKEDREFLNGLVENKYLDSNTFFLISVPAFQSLFCSHDAFLGHFRRYSNKNLKSRLNDAGLKVFHSGYFFFSLLPFRFLEVLKEKLFDKEKSKRTTGLVKWNNGKLISDFFTKVLIADVEFSFFLKKTGINLPGLSNYAICRKYA